MNASDFLVRSPAIAELLREPRPKGPDKLYRSAREKLEALHLETAFAPTTVCDRDMAACCFAGLWLYFDCLDESHRISQDILTPTGSFWHGIMHRREPDYDNAKYWFRRVGSHPVFVPLHQAAAARARDEPESAAAFLTRQSAWDPLAFIDLCAQAARGQANCKALCRQLQEDEWDLLFDYCYCHAIGARWWA